MLKRLLAAAVLAWSLPAASVVVDVPPDVFRENINYSANIYGWTNDCYPYGACPAPVLYQTQIWSDYQIHLPDHPDKNFILSELRLYLNGGSGILTISDLAGAFWQQAFDAPFSYTTTFFPDLFLSSDHLFIQIRADAPSIGSGPPSRFSITHGVRVPPRRPGWTYFARRE